MGPTFNKGLLALALAGLTAGVCHVASYAQRKRKTVPRQMIDCWEGEGGAVPVGPTQTAAQVAPRVAPDASSPDYH